MHTCSYLVDLRFLMNIFYLEIDF